MAIIRSVFRHRLQLRGPLLCVLCITACQALNVLRAGEGSSKGSLSGMIVARDGQPVGGARLVVNTWHNRRLAEAHSDTQGHFRLGPVDPEYRHPFCIFIEADGFAPQCIPGESYSIFPGEDFDLGKIQIDRGRVFGGQVIDVDGGPARHAKITYKVSGRHGVMSEQHAVTDSGGRFRTIPLPVGKLYVFVAATERQLAWIECPVQPGGEEVLKPIRLRPDVPVQGTVKDERGRPVAGVPVRANYEYETVTDAEGKFQVRGFGVNPHFQLQIRREGYVFVNRGVNVRDDGVHWHEVGEVPPKDRGPFRQLDVVLEPVAWIEGRAIDADTGKPVRLSQVVLCFFERKPGGEIVLSGCRSPRFDQPEEGRFRIPYSSPDEYHLTLSADGYQDAETFTPKTAQLKPIVGIVVKLKKKKAGAVSDVARQSIAGVVTRHGKPVKTGWVGLWRLRQDCSAGMGWYMRGRTTVAEPCFIRSAIIHNGTYSLEVPYQDDAWFVAVEEPGHALTQIGPIKIAVNEKKPLDVACVDGGSVRGRVQNVPAGWQGHLWAVAFTKTGIRVETRVGVDGTFCFQQLPPAEYGLKAGHNAYYDSELSPPWKVDLSKEEWNRQIDPWQRATRAIVTAGHETRGVELQLPPMPPGQYYRGSSE
jgi:hypothetical protein